MRSKSSNTIKGLQTITMLVSAMALAGSSVVVGKILIGHLPVFLGTFASLLVALLSLLPLLFKRIEEIRRLNLREWKYLFLQGLCGIVLFRVFTLYGLQNTGAVQAGIITGTTPAVLTILSIFFLGEKLGRRSLFSIVFAAGGCILINIVAERTASENTLLGCLLVLAAVVSEALFTIFRKQICTSVSAVTNTAVLIFCSLLLLAIPALIELHDLSHTVSLAAYLAIIYYGLFATVIAYLLWTSAVGKVDGATAGACTAAMPASSVILAAIVLGEPLHWQHALGCLLIVGGIFLSALKDVTPPTEGKTKKLASTFQKKLPSHL